MSNSDLPPEPLGPLRQRAPVALDRCALAMAAAEVGDRWSLLILREAFYGVMRYDDMRADLSIPRAMLSDRLSKLVARGLLEKRPYREAGDRLRYAYGLTEKGAGLTTALIALTRWSETYILGRPGPVEIVEGPTGQTLDAVLADSQGRIVPADRAAARLRDADNRAGQTP